MNTALGQRQAALAGVALLAALGALAGGRDEAADEPPAPAAAAAPWREAAVGVAGGGRGGCGHAVGDDTVGVVHPVLPCGAQLVVEAGGKRVRTEVVGRGAVGREHEFDLTPALASRLGVRDPATVRWRFAS